MCLLGERQSGGFGRPLPPPNCLRLGGGDQHCVRVWAPQGVRRLAGTRPPCPRGLGGTFSLSPVPLAGRLGWSLHSSLRSEVAAGYVNSGQRVHRGRCEPRCLFEASCLLAGAAGLAAGTEVPLAFWLAGKFSGSVDNWLLATILQPVPWGEGSRQYPPSGADW